jgi:hypothetical protein
MLMPSAVSWDKTPALSHSESDMDNAPELTGVISFPPIRPYCALQNVNLKIGRRILFRSAIWLR